jgi:hypothetical protein
LEAEIHKLGERNKNSPGHQPNKSGRDGCEEKSPWMPVSAFIAATATT